MHFIERLIQLIEEKQSVVCMGLDPRMDNEGEIPQYLINELDQPDKIILEFNKMLIEEVFELIPIIKPQIAFYEKYEALNALKETIKYAHKKDLLVILDAKRNDIGSTSEAYAYSIFNNYGADACTINGYFGIDGVKPFLNYKDKGLFVLVKTSNPSSSEFQNLFSSKIKGISDEVTEYKVSKHVLKRNYILMAELVKDWSYNLQKYSNFTNLGAVVGATFPNELKAVREITKNSFFLIPGYGAQGAQAKDIKYGFYENGLGGIVNSSRGITYAYNKSEKFSQYEFSKAAEEVILEMNKNINKEIGLKY
ncbi:MAG: orotidine-5'-phosphate decarboxylase [Promethearchaeota archaeon]|jgi:orotidine-5'-phosphate decarboxylase